MLDVDRERLNSDLGYRVKFNRDFLDFNTEDGNVLHAAAPLILPVVTEIVDGVYEHLFEFSYTKETFLKRQTGFEGEIAKTLADLKLDDPQMQLRKKMLSFWTARVLTANYDDPSTWQFLDNIGVMHTGQPGFKHRLNKEPLIVDLHPLSLTLGWILDIVVTIVMSFPRSVISSARKQHVIRAFNKIIWIQQDLFQRHYIRNDEEAAVNLAKVMKGRSEEQEKKEEEEMQKVKEAAAKEEELGRKMAQLATAELPEVSLQ